VKRLGEKLKESLNQNGVDGVRLEGADQGNWVVVDAGDVIVHLFRPEVREFYNIEQMWSVEGSGFMPSSPAPVKSKESELQLA